MRTFSTTATQQSPSPNGSEPHATFGHQQSGENIQGDQLQRNHKTARSPSKRPVPCDICNKVLSRAATLRNHKLTHTTQKRHKCNHCGKPYYTRDSLRAHLDTHLGKRFYCGPCDRGFSRQWSLTRHQQSTQHHDKMLKKRAEETTANISPTNLILLSNIAAEITEENAPSNEKERATPRSQKVN